MARGRGRQQQQQQQPPCTSCPQVPICHSGPQAPRTQLYQCTGCRAVRYCGAACRDAQWPEHRLVCSKHGVQRKQWAAQLVQQAQRVQEDQQ